MKEVTDAWFPSSSRFISADWTSCCLLPTTSDPNEADERNHCSLKAAAAAAAPSLRVHFLLQWMLLSRTGDQNNQPPSSPELV